MGLVSALTNAMGSSLGNICLIGLLSFIIYSYMKKYKNDQIFNSIPGPKTIPILGNALDFVVSPEDFLPVLMKYRKAFPKQEMIRVWLGFKKVVLIFGTQGTETILSSSKHIEKSDMYDYLHPWLGTGLLTSTGKKWFSRRKLLTPTFHFKILEDFVDIFNQQSSKLSSKLSVLANGQTFNVFPYITHCALDIIHETALGVPINAQDFSDSDYVKAVYRLGHIVQLRQIRPWYQYNLLYKLSGLAKEEEQCLKVLHGQSYSVIRDRKKQLKEETTQKDQQEDQVIGRKKKLAFLDMLLSCTEDGKPLSTEDIREEVDTFMFEGHDTTAAAISFSMFLLGCYPDKQNLVHEEMDSIFGNSDRDVTMDDLRDMKYMECCIKEALRIFPSVPMFARELKEDVVIDGFTVPTYTGAIVSPYILHRDPVQFPDPHSFKPERFDSSTPHNRHPYSYIPFSAGPRNCIGQKFALMEEKVVLSHIFRKYRVQSLLKENDLKVAGELILRPLERLDIKLFPR